MADDEWQSLLKSLIVSTFNLSLQDKEYSKPRTDFIDACLKELGITLNWELMGDGYYLNELDPDSLEYKIVEKIIKKNRRSSLHFRIISIKQIINPFLLINYHLMKSKYMKNYGMVTEKAFFHGTCHHSLNSICKENFDWRLRGTSRGHKFGQGVSFSPDSNYARYYGDKTVMILSDVLVSRKCKGDTLTLVPPDDTDTTGNTKRTVYVKYDDNTFYPKYIIHFKYLRRPCRKPIE